MLLYQFYSASIVGSLLAEKPRFIKTIKDLSDSNIEIGVENMQYNHDFFRVFISPLNKLLHFTKFLSSIIGVLILFLDNYK